MTSPAGRVRALFIAHRADVTATLRRMGVAAAELDDLVQDVFIVAHRRIANVPKDAEGAKGWLLDTARKLAANWHRLRRHRYEVLGWHHVIANLAAEPADPEAYLVLRDIVRRALSKLKDDDRLILVLYHLEVESAEELGERFGLTKSGTYARLHGAEENMRGLVRRHA